jgi:hypothetical protein
VIRRVEETAARVAGPRAPTPTDYVLAARIVVGPEYQAVLKPVRESLKGRAGASADEVVVIE